MDYDLEVVQETLRQEGLAYREPNMWRYWELLPLEDRANLVSPLLGDYDLEAVQDTLRQEGLAHREPNMWRYWELLPLEDRANLISLGEGWTPILRLDRLGRELGLANLLMKDEGLNPTGTFKARGRVCGRVSR